MRDARIWVVRVVGLLPMLVCLIAGAQVLPVLRDSVDLLDLAAAEAEISTENYRLEFRLTEVKLDGASGDLLGAMDVVNGEPKLAAVYHEGRKVQIGALTVKREERGLLGEGTIQIAGGESVGLYIEGEISRDAELYENHSVLDSKFPRGNGVWGELTARSHRVSGIFKMEGQEGRWTGRILPPHRPGRFTSGRFRNGGLHFSFDLRSTPQNWDFRRLALLQFVKPIDLVAFKGLRLEVNTDQPRGGLALTVWVRELDGSWYYLKSAVPLAAVRNATDILFEDFSEAVAIAPGSGDDEDFVLDLRNISHIGVGIADPSGVGVVDFSLRRCEAVSRHKTEPRTAAAEVTGRFYSINGVSSTPATRAVEAAKSIPGENLPPVDALSRIASYDEMVVHSVLNRRSFSPVVHQVGLKRADVERGGLAKEDLQYRRVSSALRDLVACLRWNPDKIRQRHVVADSTWESIKAWVNSAEGMLVETRSDDPNVWVVSCVHTEGTGEQKLVTMVFNDHRVNRNVGLTVVAPGGTRFQDGEVGWGYWDPIDQRFLARTAPAQGGGSSSQSVAMQLAPRSFWMVTFSLDGKLEETRKLKRRQFYAAGKIDKIRRSQPGMVPLTIDPAWVGDDAKAWLRLVAAGLSEGEGRVKIGERAVPLPKAVTGAGMTRVIEVPIDAAQLKNRMQLQFEVGQGSFDGYDLKSVSIVVETDEASE